jgi:rhodanese/phosphatase family protein
MTRTALVLVAAALAWGVLYYAHWVLVRRRFVAISPGRVYQSGAMGPRRVVRYARRYRIETVFDFRGAHKEDVHAEARALADNGIRHVNIPMGQLPTQSDLRRFVDLMAEEVAAGRRVLMHCKDGEGRAVAIAAIYRIEFEGWSPLQAYYAATRLPPKFKFVQLLFPRAGILSRRNRKTQLILDYVPARPVPKGYAQESAPRRCSPCP